MAEEAGAQVVVNTVWLSGAKRFPQDGRSQDAGGRACGIVIGVSIFVASGGDHAELKLPHGKVGGVAAGEFALTATGADTAGTSETGPATIPRPPAYH